MKKLVLFLSVLLPFSLFAQKEHEEAFISRVLNKAYFSQSGIDTLTFVLDRGYKYNYLIIHGSDIDEDQDGDYTEFVLIFNGTRILDTNELASLETIGRDGQMDVQVLDVSDLVNTGTNTVILGNTEIEGQTDYAVIEGVYLYATDRDLDFEQSVEDKFQSFELSVQKVFEVARGQTVSVEKTYYKDNIYKIVVATQDPDIKFSASLTGENGNTFLSAKSKNQYLEMGFTPDDDVFYTLSVKILSAPDSKDHLLSIWIFYKHQNED